MGQIRVEVSPAYAEREGWCHTTQLWLEENDFDPRFRHTEFRPGRGTRLAAEAADRRLVFGWTVPTLNEKGFEFEFFKLKI